MRISRAAAPVTDQIPFRRSPVSKAKKKTAKATKQDAADEGRTRVVESLTAAIVFLTKAKGQLFPDSVIQARGFVGAGSIVMQKRLIWLPPRDEDAQAAEIAEGTQITTAWLQEVLALRLDSVAVHIAGDAGPIAGMMPDAENPTNWVMNLAFDEDGSVDANFFRVPPTVMRRMTEASAPQR
jgi:hypothetical protein